MEDAYLDYSFANILLVNLLFVRCFNRCVLEGFASSPCIQFLDIFDIRTSRLIGIV